MWCQTEWRVGRAMSGSCWPRVVSAGRGPPDSTIQLAQVLSAECWLLSAERGLPAHPAHQVFHRKWRLCNIGLIEILYCFGKTRECSHTDRYFIDSLQSYIMPCLWRWVHFIWWFIFIWSQSHSKGELANAREGWSLIVLHHDDFQLSFILPFVLK